MRRRTGQAGRKYGNFTSIKAKRFGWPASEGKQKTFVLRIDVRRMEAIEKWAADEFRSVNGQLLYIIDQALKKNRRWKETETKVAEENE